MTTTRANIQPSSAGTPILQGGVPSLLNRLVNRWVADIIARSEREAVRAALRRFDDRELKDMGIHRLSLAMHSPKSPANGCGCSGADSEVNRS